MAVGLKGGGWSQEIEQKTWSLLFGGKFGGGWKWGEGQEPSKQSSSS